MTKNLDEIAASELAGMAEDLCKGLVPAKIFGSQEIYDLELRQIFAKSWVFVGHESEISNPGDSGGKCRVFQLSFPWLGI